MAVAVCVLMLLTMCVVGNVSINAGAATDDIIYFEKPSDWASVSCYAWGGTSGANSAWPGKAMTLVSGTTNVYSYTMPGDQTSIIFNNSNGGSQTTDLAFAGGDKIFKLADATTGQGLTGAWSDYQSDEPKTPTAKATPGTSTFYDSVAVTLTAKNTTKATYSVNGAAAVAYTDGTQITLGAAANIGDKITLDLVATDGTATDSKSYTYTKIEKPAFSGAYAYLTNTAGWENCYVYYWNGSVKNAAWPGVKLTDADKDQLGNYVVPIEEKYIGTSSSGIIFSGDGQSADLTIKVGENKIYDNKAKTWEIYDTSAIQFASFGADLASPQYKETDITVSANAAGGDNNISYKFSATIDGNETVLSDYSAVKTVVWTPTVAGTYTVKCLVKDTSGNTNERSLQYVIADDELSVKPVLKGVTPTTGSEILKGEKATVAVKASGGKTGTNLLFYKVAIKTPSSKAVNTVYYKTSNTLDFTPTELGTYTIEVSVQNSANTTVKKTYQYECVESYTPAGDPIVGMFTTDLQSSQPINKAIALTATALRGTAPYTYQFAANDTVIQSYSTKNTCTWIPSAEGTYKLTVTVMDANNKTATKEILGYVITKAPEYKRGDVNLDGVVNMKDLAVLQRYITEEIEFSDLQKQLGDVNDDGKVDMKDVSKMQRYLSDEIDEL